jgi:hypothetical protein
MIIDALNHKNGGTSNKDEKPKSAMEAERQRIDSYLMESTTYGKTGRRSVSYHMIRSIS